MIKQIFIKYYLPFFSFVLAFVFVPFVTNYNSETALEMLYALVTLVIVLTLVFGTIYYKFGDNWKLKYQKGILRKKTFDELRKNGFKQYSKSLIGIVRDYTVVITPERDSLGQTKWIDMKILFNPKLQSQYIPEYIFDIMNSNSNKMIFYNRNCIQIRKPYALKVPEYLKLMKLIDESIDKLVENNITPITFEKLGIEEYDLLKFDRQISNLIR